MLSKVFIFVRKRPSSPPLSQLQVFHLEVDPYPLLFFSFLLQESSHHVVLESLIRRFTKA